jgi:hypothetical protein
MGRGAWNMEHGTWRTVRTRKYLDFDGGQIRHEVDVSWTDMFPGPGRSAGPPGTWDKGPVGKIWHSQGGLRPFPQMAQKPGNLDSRRKYLSPQVYGRNGDLDGPGAGIPTAQGR